MNLTQSHAKRIKSLALITGSMLMVTALSACQSTTNKTEASQAHNQHGMRHQAELTEEQKQQLQAQQQQLQAQRMQVCQGKAIGDTVQLQHGHKVRTGQCQVMFQMDDASRAAVRKTFTAAHQLAHQDGNTLTAEQRDFIKQNREVIRTERQAIYQQLQAACQGQPTGKNITVQLAKQSVSGQCVLQFQANHG